MAAKMPNTPSMLRLASTNIDVSIQASYFPAFFSVKIDVEEITMPV